MTFIQAINALDRHHKIKLKGNDAIFKYQVHQAENALLEMEKVLQNLAYKDPAACFVDTSIKNVETHKPSFWNPT